MTKNFPKVRFVRSYAYSEIFCQLLGVEHTTEDKAQEFRAAKLYQDWWDKNEDVFESELQGRLGVSLKGGNIFVYVLKHLKYTFSPPVTISFAYDEGLGEPRLGKYYALHEIIHNFEYLDPEVNKRNSVTVKKLSEKYPEEERRTIGHFVTSLIEEPIMERVEKGLINLLREPYQRAYELISEFKKPYKGGNVYDYLEEVLN